MQQCESEIQYSDQRKLIWSRVRSDSVLRFDAKRCHRLDIHSQRQSPHILTFQNWSAPSVLLKGGKFWQTGALSDFSPTHVARKPPIRPKWTSWWGSYCGPDTRGLILQAGTWSWVLLLGDWYWGPGLELVAGNITGGWRLELGSGTEGWDMELGTRIWNWGLVLRACIWN